MRTSTTPAILRTLLGVAITALSVGIAISAAGRQTAGADDTVSFPSSVLAADWSAGSDQIAYTSPPLVEPAAAPAATPYAPASPGDSWPGTPLSVGGAACDWGPYCEDCLRRGYYGFFGYDSWRGVQDDGWTNNGLHAGANFGTRLGAVSDWTGIGFQLGGSVGVYNFSGTNYHLTRQDQATMQGFVTGGFFRKASETSPWSGAVVQDWMITSNYGIFGENPTLGQWRGQIGYALNPWNEVGLWGTWRGQGDTRLVNFFGPTAWRPVQQANVYYHRKWGPGGADSWLWFGVPEHDRLAGGGSLGDYTVGALANAPLSDRLMLYALVTYMHPSSRPGPTGSSDEAWCFFIGLSFFPAGNARTATVAGQCWMPQLPVANNGYFLVDTNRKY